MKIQNIKGKSIAAAIAVGCLIVGAAAGAAGEPEPEIKTVEGPERVITKDVEKTPQVCLDAINSSSDVIGMQADALLIAADAMEAAVVWDADGIDEQTAKLAEVTAPYQDALGDWEAQSKSCIEGK